MRVLYVDMEAIRDTCSSGLQGTLCVLPVVDVPVF